ncbi:MAG TPA: SurA N-terminal domain-containing protein [Spirochaetota bacterium]|nr:SurA N-terminal domain-containing protein [Spirochaetota bacterium]HPP95736.1 SurA N-terminal domain-containing protein [Spirochaetota bacterium]
MGEARNKLVQYTGYFILAFFVAIIVFSFGMPDMTSCGMADRTVVAAVNGKNVHALDFLRYRDMKFSQFKNQKMESFILDNLILELLLQEKAYDNGLTASEERIARVIKNSQEFKNPATGKFDPDYFQILLKNFRLSIDEYDKILRRELAISDLMFLIASGTSALQEEIKTRQLIENSQIQITYAFLSDEELKNRHKAEVTATDAEIDNEISTNKVKISDPKTDREKIKNEIEAKKLEKIKRGIEEKLNNIASSGGSFSAALSILNVSPKNSSQFKIGDTVKTDEKEPKEIYAITNSQIFASELLGLKENSASHAINAANGIYVFTPKMKKLGQISQEKEEIEKIKNMIRSESIMSYRRNLMKDISEKGKIVKKLKTD